MRLFTVLLLKKSILNLIKCFLNLFFPSFLHFFGKFSNPHRSFFLTKLTINIQNDLIQNTNLRELVCVEPLDGTVAGLPDLLLVLRRDLLLELLVLDGGLHVEAVGLQPVLTAHAFLLLFVLGLSRDQISSH